MLSSRRETNLEKHKDFMSPDFSDDLITTAGHKIWLIFLAAIAKKKRKETYQAK